MKQGKNLLVQLSDTHLIADPQESLRGVVTYDTFDLVVSQAASQYPQADAFLITGDLSHDGSPASYQLLGERLTRLDKPVYVIPGNHDDAINIREYLLDGNIAWPERIKFDDWQLVFLDSQVAGEEYGYLGEKELGKLRSALASGARHHVVCVHHPAIPLGSNWLDQSMLRNSEELFDAVDGTDGGVALLCGHAHQEYSEQRNGVTLLGAPSTCTQFKPRSETFEKDDLAPGFRIIELDPSGSLETRVVRLDDFRWS